MDKLSYFDLLSPLPIRVKNIGGVKSPKLRDISRIGKDTYDFYVSLLLMDVEKFFTMIGSGDFFKLIPEEEKEQLNIFELMISMPDVREMLQKTISFFMDEHIEFDQDNACFKVIDGEGDDSQLVGIINKETYPLLCSLIFQRNEIKVNKEETSKPKNKKAAAILDKIKKGRANMNKHKKADENLELGNVISSVANKHESLNILNIWDITIFQLWDSFYKMTRNDIYEIQKMSVAAWGDENKQFNSNEWYKKIERDN